MRFGDIRACRNGQRRHDGVAGELGNAFLTFEREAGVVATTRDAQSIRYELPQGAVTRIIEILYSEFCEK